MDIEKLKEVRKRKKVTFKELSALSGVPERTIYDIFSGNTKNPRIDTMQAIENALGIEEGVQFESAKVLTETQRRLVKAFDQLIPPMQEYILEMVEKLIEQPQNVSKRA